MKAFLFSSILLQTSFVAYSQDTTGTFPPPAFPVSIYAVESIQNINIDGRLNEPAWEEAPVINNFFRMEPRQGGNYLYKSSVKILFDKKNLYFGVFCKDSLGKKGVRVQDYRRDFNFPDNDEFFIQLDPQNLKRFCASFQATPVGTQRDAQIFDDNYTDNEWDALWKVRTSITDSGYYAEFAIPFKSLRYSRNTKDSASWGITFSRMARRDYEQTVFPAIPQAYSPYRMVYAAQLKGLKLPSPSINFRVQPYALYQYSKSTDENNSTTHSNTFKMGGEAKWAVNPHAVIDLTFNTDFAQADVDEAVNNLTRFNVFFPEKRQFFLENSGVYAGSDDNEIIPFFSRTIGLENSQFNAEPIPIDAGIRYTDRTTKRTIAGLYVRQASTEAQGVADFSVLRYLQNFGTQSNAGIMLTQKSDEADDEKGFTQHSNTTLTVDGLIRPDNKLSILYLASASKNNTNDSIGIAGYVKANYSTNNWYLFSNIKTVSEKYLPAMGFVFQNNVTRFNDGGYYKWRPSGKLSKLIRSYEPGFFYTSYHDAKDFKTQTVNFDIFPVWIFTPGNGLITFDFLPTWEQFYFTPLGIQVKPGKYFYTQYSSSYFTNDSKKISGSLNVIFGNYYDGKQTQLNAGLRLAPNPKIAFNANYQLITVRNLGINNTDENLSITTLELRLAANPRLHASVLYQYNSYDKQSRWNARGSWEFAPLSFLYIVFNDNSFQNSPVHNQSVINKITYLKQF